ncbi:MAG: PspC domain-containing protein [Alphaproteobacteria bacterium]|nr:PspC domain-containing protein [Alphaproteobacteria bacterium]
MRFPKPTLLTRDDTVLGVCQALGQDFGFNPLFLRVPLAVGLLWNPVAVIAIYVAAALFVGVIRIAMPDPVQAEAAAAAPTPAEAAVAEYEPQPLAA